MPTSLGVPVMVPSSFPQTQARRALAAQYRISTPLVSPYALGGWQWRRTSTGGTSNTENGAMFGLGVQLNLGVSLFLEGIYEFNEELTGVPDFDTDPIVIKGGIMFG